MNVKFENNSYLNAVIEKKDKDLNSESKIFKHVQSTLHFSYINVTPQEFNKQYIATGWFARKVIALPAAIWSATVKTIYHLAKTIIIGFCKTFFDGGKYSQTQLFYMGRDLQESFGWLVSLFNDRYGQYYIQASKFHKTCYHCFLTGSGYSIPKQSNSLSINSDQKHNDGQNFQENNASNLDSSQPTQATSKIADYSESDLDEELKNANDLRSDRQRENLYIQLVEKYLTIGCLEKALKINDKLFGNTKDKFIVRIAEAYLKKTDGEKAIRVLEKIRIDFYARDLFLEKITESNYLKDYPEEALKTLEELELLFITEVKEKFILKIADVYLAKGETEKAVNIFEKFTGNITKKEAFLEKASEAYHLKGNLEEALATIEKLVINTQAKEKFILKIAEAYLAKDNQEKAIKTFDQLSHKTQVTEEAFLDKVAESYYLKDKLEEALKIMDKMISDLPIKDIRSKEQFIIKIATTYKNKGDRVKAIETINKIYDVQQKYPFLIQLAQSFFSENNTMKVIEIIINIAQDALNKKIGNERNIFNLKVNLATKTFFTNLAKNCLLKTKEDFANKNTQAIIQEITRQATHISTQQDYICAINL